MSLLLNYVTFLGAAVAQTPGTRVWTVYILVGTWSEIGPIHQIGYADIEQPHIPQGYTQTHLKNLQYTVNRTLKNECTLISTGIMFKSKERLSCSEGAVGVYNVWL